MRDQLDEANKNVTVLKHDVRVADRDLHVSEQDKNYLRQSLRVSFCSNLHNAWRSCYPHETVEAGLDS